MSKEKIRKENKREGTKRVRKKDKGRGTVEIHVGRHATRRMKSLVFCRRLFVRGTEEIKSFRGNLALGSSLLLHRDAAARPGLSRPLPSLCQPVSTSWFVVFVSTRAIEDRPCHLLSVGLFFCRMFRAPRLIVW